MKQARDSYLPRTTILKYSRQTYLARRTQPNQYDKCNPHLYSVLPVLIKQEHRNTTQRTNHGKKSTKASTKYVNYIAMPLPRLIFFILTLFKK
jgi:5-bromo-4-chloroindolyl phosphate hydrolysis protein